MSYIYEHLCEKNITTLADIIKFVHKHNMPDKVVTSIRRFMIASDHNYDYVEKLCKKYESIPHRRVYETIGSLSYILANLEEPSLFLLSLEKITSEDMYNRNDIPDIMDNMNNLFVVNTSLEILSVIYDNLGSIHEGMLIGAIERLVSLKSDGSCTDDDVLQLFFSMNKFGEVTTIGKIIGKLKYRINT